jgi:predicted DNA-binding transcriptional regulator AlpA
MATQGAAHQLREALNGDGATQGAASRMVPIAELQPTMSIWPEVGKALGLGRAETYAAVARGDIPSLRIGGRLIVPTAAVRRLLQLDHAA